MVAVDLIRPFGEHSKFNINECGFNPRRIFMHFKSFGQNRIIEYCKIKKL